MDRVVSAIGRYGIVGPTVDIQGRPLGRVDVAPAPAVLEVVSGLGCGSLLVERRPVTWQLRRPLPRKKAGIPVFIVPQPVAGLTAERIAWLGLSWQGKDMPLLAAACGLS